MKTSDITLSIFIIFIFVLLQLFNILAIGIKNIEDNWPLYQCNPMILPFAGMFGHDGVKNFSYCIQNMNMNFMPYLTDPLNYMISNLTDSGNQFADLAGNFTGLGSGINSGIIGILEDGISVVMNIFISLQIIIIKIKDTFAKVIGIIITLTYILAGIELTALSLWAGPIGAVTKWVITL
jgi:hypothetical protein